MEKSNICKKLAVFVVITVILAVFAGCIGGKEETPIPTTTTPDEEKETIRLVVEQSYPQIEEEFSLPFAYECRQILESVGFNVVDEKATPYDYTLLVEVTGRAFGATYFPGGFLYTAASIDGNFSLSGPNTDITRSFCVKGSPPESYTYASESSLPKKPRNAPFRSLVWKKHFFLLIYDAWGIEPIIKALEDEDSMIRTNAAEVLGEIGTKETVPVFVKALEDKSWQVRTNAAEALGEIGPEAKEAVPALIEALRDEVHYVRLAAAEALSEIGSEEVVPALIEALEGDDSAIWRGAAEALGKIGTKEAVSALIRALEDEVHYVRSYAAKALGEIGSEAKEAVPALIEALEDEDLYVRRGAALALGKIGTKEAVPALIRALEDENSMVCYLAAGALKKITGQNFGKDQSKWQQWWEENK